MSSTKPIKYTRNVGKKFNADGSAKAFPGNTVICHILKDCPTYQFLLNFRKILEDQLWIKKFALLPPSSYHMTVFEGVCDKIRKPFFWTSKLSMDATLEEVDQLLIKEWQTIQKPTGFTMQMDFHFIGGTIGIRLKPINHMMEQKIRLFRDILAEKFGIKMPGHGIYHFHISFAYQIIKLSFKEQIQARKFMKKKLKEYREQFGTLILNEPELTFFTDMTDFAPDRASAQQNSQN